VVENLIEYLLFTEEAKLTEPVSGTSGFDREFAQTGPKDHSGRSLRDLDLKRRLFKHPCSFLIYSEAFDAMPNEAKDRVYNRLWEILTSRDQSSRFAGLSQPERQTILEILLETKSGLPEYWRLEPKVIIARRTNHSLLRPADIEKRLLPQTRRRVGVLAPDLPRYAREFHETATPLIPDSNIGTLLIW
jgi:hypothetical protein